MCQRAVVRGILWKIGIEKIDRHPHAACTRGLALPSANGHLTSSD
jgi:hypothetical protein